LPQPFGPTIAVIFVGKGTTVESTKDLNPTSLMDFKRISGAVYKLEIVIRENNVA